MQHQVTLHHVLNDGRPGWLHTHGLATLGLPELEVRDVPAFLGPAAAGVILALADYMTNDAPAPVVPGQEIQLEGHPPFRLIEAPPDEIHDASHYKTARLMLADVAEPVCSACPVGPPGPVAQA
jgi:hypothetical protein